MVMVVLLIAGIACLVAGILTDTLALTWVAAGISAVALALLGYGAWRSRASSRRAESTDTEAAEAEHLDADEEPVDEADVVEAATAVPCDADPVLVLGGRKRYHLPGCALVEGERAEEITAQEAIAEGFTPCTRCVPQPAQRV